MVETFDLDSSSLIFDADVWEDYVELLVSYEEYKSIRIGDEVVVVYCHRHRTAYCEAIENTDVYGEHALKLSFVFNEEDL